VSATFHGRDVFAPVSAHLARGEPLAAAGDPCDPRGLEAVALPHARVEAGTLVAHAIAGDRFGNLALDAGADDLYSAGVAPGSPCQIEAGGQRIRARCAATFADVPAGALLVYEDSFGQLAVAVNRGSAAERLGVARDDELRIHPG
jgi:S-adenosylmethionine hydrolase